MINKIPKRKEKKKNNAKEKLSRPGLTLTRTWALESRVDLYTDGVRRRVTV
jgi:hypothetical protein